MSSLRKRGRVWYFTIVDENGEKRERAGCPDKGATQSMANQAETTAGLIRQGLVDPIDDARRTHEARHLIDHIADFHAFTCSKVTTLKQANQARGRLTKLIGKTGATRFRHLTPTKVQAGLKQLRDGGLSHQTCNHYLTALRSFLSWARRDGRTNINIELSGFAVATDRRHDRRTISLDDLRRLIEMTSAAPDWRGLTGPTRALVYRLAASTGLRYSEIKSLTPESFSLDATAPSVSVQAGYAKNRERAVVGLTSELVGPLRAALAGKPPGKPVFGLKRDAGALMLRGDLERAGIAYRDDAGEFFDFHSLRCQFATLLDAAHVSPKVVQRLMRHSTPALTDRYTRPLTEARDEATRSMPALMSKPFADYLPPDDAGMSRIESDTVMKASSDQRKYMRALPAQNTGIDDDAAAGSLALDTQGKSHTMSGERFWRPPAPPVVPVVSGSSRSQAAREGVEPSAPP